MVAGELRGLEHARTHEIRMRIENAIRRDLNYSPRPWQRPSKAGFLAELIKPEETAEQKDARERKRDADMLAEFGQAPIGDRNHVRIRMAIDQRLRFTEPLGSRQQHGGPKSGRKWCHRGLNDLPELARVERDHTVNFGLFEAGRGAPFVRAEPGLFQRRPRQTKLFTWSRQQRDTAHRKHMSWKFRTLNAGSFCAIETGICQPAGSHTP